MKNDGLQRMLDFLNFLDENNIHFYIEQHAPEWLTVTLTLVGTRVEVMFTVEAKSRLHLCAPRVHRLDARGYCGELNIGAARPLLTNESRVDEMMRSGGFPLPLRERDRVRGSSMNPTRQALRLTHPNPPGLAPLRGRSPGGRPLPQGERGPSRSHHFIHAAALR